MSAPVSAEDWLKEWFGTDATGYVTLWTKRTKQTTSFAAADLPAIARTAEALAFNDEAYYGVGLQINPPTTGRGKVDTVCGIGGVWFDFDIQDAGHKETKLPASIAEVSSLLLELPASPTALINSGGGLHAYWCFDQLWRLETVEERSRAKALSAAWQRAIQAKGREKGWKLDGTADLARILRLPGTFNRKLEAPRRVYVQEWSGERYAPARLEELVGNLQASLAGSSGVSAKSKKKKRGSAAPTSEKLLQCLWAEHCVDEAASLPEPEWFGLLTLLSRCDDGREYAHEWSASYPGYTTVETDKKFVHAANAKGPHTCRYIADHTNGGDYCKGCRFAGRITSPIELTDPATVMSIDYAYVVDAQEFFDLSSGRRLSKEKFSDQHSAEIHNGGAAKAVLNRPQLVRPIGYDYLPGGQQMLGEHPDTRINLWVNDGVEPRSGDVGPFLEHLAYIVPDDEARRHLLQWLAFTVQKPAEKIKHAVILSGKQGTGKSFFGRLLKTLHGPSNVHEVDSDELHSQFTAWLEGKKIILVEELMAAGRLELANKIKPMITQELMRVNQKNRPVYEIRNLASFFCTTNFEDPIYVSEGDRRWWIYQSPAEPKQPEYYDELEHWTAVNAGAIKQYLLELDITGFNHNAAAPMTESKRQLIQDSLPPVEYFLRQKMEEGVYPLNGDLVQADQVFRSVQLVYPRATQQQVAKALRVMGAQKLPRIRLGTSGFATVYAIQRQELWLQAPPTQVRDALQRGGNANPLSLSDVVAGAA